MEAREHLTRIAQQAADDGAKAGGDIRGEPQWHYAHSIASGIHLVAEAVATGFAAVADAIQKETYDADE